MLFLFENYSVIDNLPHFRMRIKKYGRLVNEKTNSERQYNESVGRHMSPYGLVGIFRCTNVSFNISHVYE